MTASVSAPLSTFTEAKTRLADDVRALGKTQKPFFQHSLIARVEVKMQDIDFLLWLSQQDHPTKIYWQDRNQEMTIAGIGAADTLLPNTSESYASLLLRLNKRLISMPPQFRYWGGMCFHREYEPQAEWKNWSRACFVLPLIEIRKTSQGTVLACNLRLTKDIKYEIQNICTKIMKLENIPSGYTNHLPGVAKRINYPDENTWKASVAYIINSIMEGKIDKLVLARAVQLDLLDSVNPFLLLSQLKKQVNNCFSFLFQFRQDQCFLGTSPERLYHRKGDRIESEALAGTRPRSEQENEDKLFCNQLLNSTKDRDEHNYVVEMIKKSLQPLCREFAADDVPTVLQWSANHHLISRFSGTLKKGINDAHLLGQLHPTPAVAGSPIQAAYRQILQIEEFERGWYCGPLGYVGLEETEFAVALRCALIKSKNVYLYAGAGIIKDSKTHNEWAETESKLSHFLKIFNVT